jgi:hypothetical protein
MGKYINPNYLKEYRQRPEVKAHLKAYFTTSEYRAKVKEYQQRPEVKAHLKAYQKEYY